MLTIEKGIPMPEARMGRSPTGGYPFKKMSVGDSFLVGFQGRASEKIVRTTRRRINSHVQKAKQITGFHFAIRTVKDGIRVWRVK